jgi:AmmeMemoRadiSam system protein A
MVLMLLNKNEADELLQIAHAALGAAVRDGIATHVALEKVSPMLREPGAAFVTLTENGDLRGCIGTLEAYRPLAEDVAANSMASALRDPRFPPVSPRDLPQITLEISVLSKPAAFPVSSEAELLQKLQPGVHGLIIEDGMHRATFLPAVWEQLPDPHDFVAHLKHKAGLPPHYWSPTMKCQVYSVQKISRGV